MINNPLFRENDACPICLETISQDNLSSIYDKLSCDCDVKYHNDCLTKWLNSENANSKQCPTCRKWINPIVEASNQNRTENINQNRNQNESHILPITHSRSRNRLRQKHLYYLVLLRFILMVLGGFFLIIVIGYLTSFIFHHKWINIPSPNESFFIPLLIIIFCYGLIGLLLLFLVFLILVCIVLGLKN